MDIVIYQTESGDIGVKLVRDSVWLTQRKMAELFEASTDNIGLHLKNIFAEGEWDESATTEEVSVVQAEGNPVINDVGLAALTLLIAESNPKDKKF
jgi:hypothetical protein